MVLELINNLSKELNRFTVTDLEDSTLFYHFELEFGNKMVEGEYTYLLYDDDRKLVAEGMCQIGDYVPETTAYTENNNYIQYQG